VRSPQPGSHVLRTMKNPTFPDGPKRRRARRRMPSPDAVGRPRATLSLADRQALQAALADIVEGERILSHARLS